MRYGSPSLLVILGISLVVLSAQALAQPDPLALQKQAIQRIDAFVNQFRMTGEMKSGLADLVQADAELDASNRALAARSDWTHLALGLTKRGHVYRMQGQWPSAITLYQQAAEAAKQGADSVRQADALAWKGLAEQSRRNLGQAFVDAKQAVALAETTQDKDVLARALDVLGIVQIAQGDIPGASDTLNREVAVAAEAADPIAKYYAYFNRSDVYHELGKRCDFQREFDPCYQALDRARADLEQAQAIARSLGYPGLARQTEQFIANVEARRALIRSQERTHSTLQRASVFHPKRAEDVLVTEKFVASPGQIPPELAQLYEESKRMEQQLGGFAEIAEARSQYGAGLMSEMQGNNDAALQSYMRAVDTLERDRRALRDERSRSAFLEDRIGIYYAPVLQLLERHRYAEAFELLERARSRAMADLLSSRKVALGRPEEQKLYAESVTLRTRIASAQSELLETAAGADAAKHRARLTSLQGQIRALEADNQTLATRIAAEAPHLQSMVVSQPASLKALQQSMREEHYELLQYVVLEQGLIVWHIGPDSVLVRNVFLPRTEVMSKVRALQKSLGDRETRFDEPLARELFLYLIQPVLNRIHSDRLVIIPHEDLTYIPFQVFQDPANGRFMGERFQISYAPSASVLLALRRSSGIADGKLLAVADPALAAAGPEVEAIAKFFPARSKVVRDVLAREVDVKTWSAQFDVIHLAVHGKFNAAEPLLSYLSLAGGGDNDGKLTAAEMFGLPLDQNRLLVLSGCETGRAEATHGNEILGMVRALIYAGAGTLVVSYWKVDSAATALWMRTFYETARSRPLQEAARAALARVKATPEYAHPYYWAAFTMVGR